jgi:L-alanine-DL-glutamate epimerase-like enolase superfamily enzyme
MDWGCHFEWAGVGGRQLPYGSGHSNLDWTRHAANRRHLAIPLYRSILAARPVTMSAISAVDTALWDIKAKTLDVPLYQLLGGASRDGVLVYGHASGVDIEDTVKAVSEDVALGYKAIRAQSGVPGLQTTYGLGRKKSTTNRRKLTRLRKICGAVNYISSSFRKEFPAHQAAHHYSAGRG